MKDILLFQSAIPSHPLNFAGLSSFCNDVNAINEEFVGIPQVSAKIDELPPGAEVKNRYANVIPLPETRVPLQRLNNDALTEYINASYVRVSETFCSSWFRVYPSSYIAWFTRDVLVTAHASLLLKTLFFPGIYDEIWSHNPRLNSSVIYSYVLEFWL